ncbi:hypothetical protein HPB47_019709 [Ixodes persulcatus]|uniref:Uncharacterized protein n=1 Tax=Ixodes persulcatus TaxID=34615 RepID=A0AC60QID9_IXOPE|nr:hypothetical protein HPB47_019709 [Ixodes persulcatus]
MGRIPWSRGALREEDRDDKGDQRQPLAPSSQDSLTQGKEPGRLQRGEIMLIPERVRLPSYERRFERLGRKAGEVRAQTRTPSRQVEVLGGKEGAGRSLALV